MCFARESRQLYRCHIHPASGRVFCYNMSIEKKNFCPMNNLAKVVLGILAYNYATTNPSRKRGHVGTVRNVNMYEIPNNGGL